jgi:O-antigen/teichoic acid export membrane protein
MMLALGLSSLANWVFAIYRQVLQAANLVGWDEALNLISTVLILVVLAATLHFRWPVATYFMLVLTPPLVPMLLRLWRVRRLVPDVRLGFALDWPTVRPLAGTSAWLFLMTAAEMAANHYRPIVLAQQASLGDVADFRIVQQVAGFATLMMSGLLSALYPAVARLEAAGDSRRVRLALVHGTRTLLWLHVLVLVPMALVAAPLLTLYVGTSFAHLAPALALWLLTLLGYHNAIVSSLVLARGRIAPLALTTLVSALLCLVLSWWLVPRFGLMALVWAYALHAAIQLAVMYLWMVPLAGAGSGWVLLAQVVPQPLVAAGVGALATALLVYGARAPLWLGALVFAAIVAAFALRPGGVLADWRSLKAAA